MAGPPAGRKAVSWHKAAGLPAGWCRRGAAAADAVRGGRERRMSGRRADRVPGLHSKSSWSTGSARRGVSGRLPHPEVKRSSVAGGPVASMRTPSWRGRTAPLQSCPSDSLSEEAQPQLTVHILSTFVSTKRRQGNLDGGERQEGPDETSLGRPAGNRPTMGRGGEEVPMGTQEALCLLRHARNASRHGNV